MTTWKRVLMAQVAHHLNDPPAPYINQDISVYFGISIVMLTVDTLRADLPIAQAHSTPELTGRALAEQINRQQAQIQERTKANG